MEVWERPRVLALAADDASRRAAVPLLSAGRWPESGATDEPGAAPLLWGRCQGTSTYEVVARPGSAYACSCPSRKAPCKHALALLLRWSAGELAAGTAPAYATRMRAPAGAASASEPVDPPAPVDPTAAAQRAAARAERVAGGLDELARWLGDQVRGGIAGLERSGRAEVDAVAARMVDAQAPGVASMLRGIPPLLAQDGWPERVLEALAGLHLLIEAHRGLERLPDLAPTVRSRVGYPVAKAAVLAGPAVVDTWWAVGSVDVLEGRLESRRVWLRGLGTGRWALLLSFAVPGAGLDESVAVGDVLVAALHFYPGSGELRALVGEQWPVERDGAAPPSPPEVSETLPQVRGRWAALLAHDPWAVRMPALLRATPVPPGGSGQPWRLRDEDGTAVRLVGLVDDPWLLLALGTAGPVTVAGEWSRPGFRPLRVLADDGPSDEVRDSGPRLPRLLAVAR